VQGPNAVTKGFDPVVEGIRGTLIDSQKQSERGKLIGVTKAEAKIIGHGSSNTSV